jgi:hypothetical protein
MPRHPDVHRPWSDWSEEQTLHVAVGYSNPFRWQSRRMLMNRFRDHMAQQANVVLHVGELAYGDRPWEVTSPDRPTDLQLRTEHELFHKENIQQRVIQEFPEGWKYGMACDGDFHMVTVGWALETIHQLQHYSWLQPFSSYADVTGHIYGQANLPLRINTSFFFNYVQNGYKVSPQYHNGFVNDAGEFVGCARPMKDFDYDEAMQGVNGMAPGAGTFMRGCGATGGAVAFTRKAFEMTGGFLDRCILGHADWYMAHQIVGVEPPDIHTQRYHPGYKQYVTNWGQRAARLRRNVGYVDAMALHFFHGSKSRRAYSSRDVILAEEQFDPMLDVHPDSQGILQLAPERWQLRDKIRKYFLSRTEDDPNIYPPERVMV